jgi:hypothetical protein
MKKKTKTVEHSIPVKEHQIFEAGTFTTKAGEKVTYTEANLDELCETFNPSEPPAYIPGHSSDWRGTTMIPKLGEIKGGLKRIGSKLYAVGAEFSDRLAGWVREGFYDQRSCEIYKQNGKLKLSAIAMLGAQPPAIAGMPPINDAMLESDYMFSKRDKVLEFAQDTGGGTMIDEVEALMVDDTVKDLSEACANFITKVEAAFNDNLDPSVCQERISLASYDLSSEISNAIYMHFTANEKLENIEEQGEGEMSSKKQKLVEFAKKLFTKQINRKESSDMEKEQEAKLVKENEDLKKQVKEFSEANAAAVAKAKEAEEKAADVQLLKDVKEFCEKNELTTKKHQDMKIQEILFATAKANQTIEFAAKDKDGKDTLEKLPVLTVLQNALKSLQIAVPPEDEMAQEFAEEDKGKKPEVKRSDFIAKVDAYIEKHATEFSGLTTVQARAKVITLESNQKIKL